MKPSLLVLLQLVVCSVHAAAPTCSADRCRASKHQNRIVEENKLPGASPIEWDINGAGSPDIQGFATQMSVVAGSTVELKIRTASTVYRVDIYRMGYYSGKGARLVDSVQPLNQQLGVAQPECRFEADTLLVDCANWHVSAEWAVPATAISGIYFARLVIPIDPDEKGAPWRADRSPLKGDPKFARGGTDPNQKPSSSVPQGGYGAAGMGIMKNGLTEPRASHVFFVVRDDSHCSEVLVQTMDTTWQTYNCWGTTNTYGVACDNPDIHAGSPTPPNTARRAFKASYNRPFATRAYRASNMPFNSEYPLVRWLERNGYDVSYWSGVDADRTGAALLASNHKVYISVGHDEYWSGPQRQHVEAARDKGLSLAFLSGNEVFWRVRWEADATNSSHRIVVSYKDTQSQTKLDPVPGEWTGTWRDGRSINPVGAHPENELTGTIYTVNAWRNDFLEVPAKYSDHRFWRNTRIANLTSADKAIVVPVVGLLGHEWDTDVQNGFRPAGLVHMSSTSMDNVQYIQDEGSTYDTGSATHHLTMHKRSSGSIVFGAGTCQWSWGLDGHHDLVGGLDLQMGKNCYSLRVGKDQLVPDGDRDIQQATYNMFTDMGATPLNLQTNLIRSSASSDIETPHLVDYVWKMPRIMQGVAQDVGGGVVASIEISDDSGESWNRVTVFNHTSNRFTHFMTHHANFGRGDLTSVLVRMSDDSGNLCEPVFVPYQG